MFFKGLNNPKIRIHKDISIQSYCSLGGSFRGQNLSFYYGEGWLPPNPLGDVEGVCVSNSVPKSDPQKISTAGGPWTLGWHGPTKTHPSCRENVPATV